MPKGEVLGMKFLEGSEKRRFLRTSHERYRSCETLWLLEEGHQSRDF